MRNMLSLLLLTALFMKSPAAAAAIRARGMEVE